MSPELINQRIAEKCPNLGWWKDHESHWHFKDGSRMRGGSPMHDLNACHEMEKVIYDKAKEYCEWIDKITKHHNELYALAFADAPTRWQAFLRTVGGWEE